MVNVIEISRQPDADGYSLHFTGGFRAYKVAADAWMIQPVLVDGKPCTTGPHTKLQLEEIARRAGYRAIAFQSYGWTGGSYYSSWRPIVPGQENHFLAPATRWRNIARNMTQSRLKAFLENSQDPSEHEIARARDDQGPIEGLAQFISMSLRNMDVSVEQIAHHYHDQLVNQMASGRMEDTKVSTTSDTELYAHVHSFFMHLGAVRDYFAALIACRVGYPAKVDSMRELCKKIAWKCRPDDSLLDLLLTLGDIEENPATGKTKMAGWLWSVSEIRNTFVHRRPYGSRVLEKSGWVQPVLAGPGLYRYFRPVLDLNDAQYDVLDLVSSNYERCNLLLMRAFEVAGYDASLLQLTDADVISDTIVR